jgi:starch phosphorylase
MDEINPPQTVAYFSMEIGVEPNIPTYSGGLGVLAGDTIRSAADMQLPVVAVTLVYHKGYFEQTLDANGWQHEQPVQWNPADYLEELPHRVAVKVEGRNVQMRAWRYRVQGASGGEVPVLFLDTDLPGNSTYDRSLTDCLYGGDERYRLCQEVILGMGGVRMLYGLGFRNLQRFHMNEGHASLLTLELLEDRARMAGRFGHVTHEDIEAVRRLCVFTTHTPVPAGHDKFSMELVNRILGPREIYQLKDVFCCDGILNLTYLALNLSHYINGVAKQHGEVSRLMFSRYVIDAITDGVHAGTWTAEPFAQIYDRHISDWRQDNFSMRGALGVPRKEIWEAHTACKKRLIDHVNGSQGAGMEMDVLTLGFARRAAAYKRADLLFSDIERLKGIVNREGRIQVIYGGKAHPADQPGKEMIRRIIQGAGALEKHLSVAYLENYDMTLGQLLTSGVDVWLNTPEPPLEASGTSGMKAALNGVPSLSVLDGWWIEGCIEGVTGWSVGIPWRLGNNNGHDRSLDAASLYEKLEQAVIPTFYKDRDRFIDMMCHCIALNGSFFNTQRMLQQYVQKAYFT